MNPHSYSQLIKKFIYLYPFVCLSVHLFIYLMCVYVCVSVCAGILYTCLSMYRGWHLIFSFYSAYFFTSDVSLSLELSLFWARLEVSKPFLCSHLPLKLGYAKLQTCKDSRLVALDLLSKLPVIIAQQMLLHFYSLPPPYFLTTM